jgi:hypothetical protein
VETKTTDKLVPREIAALLSSERLILRETKRAVTPFGGRRFVEALHVPHTERGDQKGDEGSRRASAQRVRQAHSTLRKSKFPGWLTTPRRF